MLDWWSFKIYKYFSLWLELNYWAFKSKFSINSTHSTSRRHAMSHHHAITNQSINISSNKNIERQYQHGRPVQQSRPRDSSRWSMRASLTFASSISLYSCTWDVRWYRIVSMISIESDSCLPCMLWASCSIVSASSCLFTICKPRDEVTQPITAWYYIKEW